MASGPSQPQAQRGGVGGDGIGDSEGDEGRRLWVHHGPGLSEGHERRWQLGPS